MLGDLTRSNELTRKPKENSHRDADAAPPRPFDIEPADMVGPLKMTED